MGRLPIPEITIIPISSLSKSRESQSLRRTDPIDSRTQQVEEFLQSRSLSQNSQKAYRQDLQHFLNWTQTPWNKVTPKQAAQFKHHLTRMNPETGKPILSDASITRVLGTLQSFYQWMVTTQAVDRNPTASLVKPKAKAADPQALNREAIEAILESAANTSLPERNLALILVLLHGLKAGEICYLNREDYDGRQLQIRGAKATQTSNVPLNPTTQAMLNSYLEWRQVQGEPLQPTSPLFVSHSHRNKGQRIGYDAIRKMIGTIEQATGLNLNTHQFRHTFTTELILKGTHPQEAMSLTRHQSKQNFQRYIKGTFLTSD
ncbi:MAG: tyrosine-type recombinase/integrase [Leptolyngbyaceae cyanobacterium bins.59]|nr:tyrosine-type recombinase/integrase [Leptolyngbyaceae cyanobacterium bins.59]